MAENFLSPHVIDFKLYKEVFVLAEVLVPHPLHGQDRLFPIDLHSICPYINLPYAV